VLFVDTLRLPIDLMFVAERDGPYKEIFHFHPFVELFYVHEGRGQVIVDQRVHEVAPGTLLFYRPFQPHYQQMQIKPDQPYIRSQFRYDPVFFAEYLKPFPALHRFHDELSRSAEVLHVQQGPAIAQLDGFIRDASLWFGTYDANGELEHHTLFLLSLFQRIQPLWQFGGSTAIRQPTSDPFVVRVLEWIDEHHGEPFQLETLAKAVHLSPKYLSNLFRKTTGKTITDFLTIRRLKHASQLLQTTALSVQEVSELSGYSNCSYFCHTFRKYVGMTPGQFRSQPLVPD
jgi:AraC-like DNA-binding protein